MSVLESLDQYKSLVEEERKLRSILAKGGLQSQKRAAIKDRLYQIKLQKAGTPAFQSSLNGLIYIDGKDEPRVPSRLCGNCGGKGEAPDVAVEWGEGYVTLPTTPCKICLGTGIDLSKERDLREAARDLYREGVLDAGYEPEVADKLVKRKFSDIDDRVSLD